MLDSEQKVALWAQKVTNGEQTIDLNSMDLLWFLWKLACKRLQVKGEFESVVYYFDRM